MVILVNGSSHIIFSQGKARKMLGMVVLFGCFHAFRIFAPGFQKAVSGGFGYQGTGVGGTPPFCCLIGQKLNFFFSFSLL